MLPARLALIAVSAVLLATALPVAADEGRLTAEAVEYSDPASQGGLLAMLAVRDAMLDEQGREVNGARPWLDLQAASIVAVEYMDTRSEATVPDSSLPAVEGSRDRAAPKQSEFSQAQGHLAEYQAGFQVHAYSVDGTVSYTLDAAAGRFLAADRAVLSQAGLGTSEDANPAHPEDRFALVDRPGPWVLHYETSDQMRATLQGDFIVELMGVSLQVEGDGKEATLRSGSWTSPLNPAAPPEATEVAHTRTTRFLRLTLTDATLEFATSGGAPVMRWASSEATADFTGRAALVDAQGPLHTAAGEIDLRHERYVLPEGSRLAAQAREGALLDLEVLPAPLSPHGGTMANVPAPASAALVGTGAILALAIAVGIGLLRRLLRLPALADVETAIEEGEYRKAARLAGRILARLPGSEEAMLGRAIALSKAGRPQDVVAELTQHLALRPASDGSLHYVLGLAQLDAGHAAEGQASLREAVRLTPSLQAEVAPRLGKAFSVAQPTTRETHGYA